MSRSIWGARIHCVFGCDPGSSTRLLTIAPVRARVKNFHPHSAESRKNYQCSDSEMTVIAMADQCAEARRLV